MAAAAVAITSMTSACCTWICVFCHRCYSFFSCCARVRRLMLETIFTSEVFKLNSLRFLSCVRFWLIFLFVCYSELNYFKCLLSTLGNVARYFMIFLVFCFQET